MGSWLGPAGAAGPGSGALPNCCVGAANCVVGCWAGGYPGLPGGPWGYDMTSPVLDGFEPTLAHSRLQRRQQGFRCRALRCMPFCQLDFANQRQYVRTEVFDLLLEVQEASED